MFEELGRTLDNLVRHVTGGGKTTQIDLRTEPVSVPYPGSAPVKLRLEIGIGKLTLAPGGEMLVDGTVTYNIAEWKPEVSVEGGKVLIKQGQGWPLWPVWGNMKNEWDFKLGTSNAYELSVAKGVAEGMLALGGVPLTAAIIDIGAGKTTISFDRPNPQRAEQVEFKTGAGEMIASGLLNANAARVNVKGGTGKVELDFNGETLSQDVFGDIDLGVGEAVITVKPGIPVRVSMSQGLGNIKVIGSFKPAGEHTYETPDFNTATEPKLTLKIGTGIGSVRVSNG